MEPPSFPPSGLCTVRAAPGSDATLVLPLPSGTPPFNYQWSRAGASLDERFTASDDAGGVRLTVSAARTGDTDVYTLQANNASGSDSARVRLEVCADEAPTGEDPPSFLRRLQDLTVKVGTRTRFLVEIVSSTECKVTWYRNERRLLEAERVALARDGNFWCADVAAVSVDDAGRWTCTAENLGGRASCSAHLNVLVPKAYKRPEFVEELRALLTEQGTVSLECKVVGVPTPLLRWFKDSREIKAGDVFALTANAEDPTSLGTYTCEAVNCMGRAYSSSKVHVVGRGSREGSTRPSSSSVTPEPPPIFTKELEDQFVRICEPLTLGCHIVVPPWPRSVVWYNKEGKIEPSERYHVLEDGAGGYLLEVPSAEWPDEGEWKCVATSTGGRVGIATCYVTMDVPKNFRKPRFMENLQAVLTEEGLVSFECKVVGFPTPVLSWFKDGQELKPGDVYQLTGTNSLGSYCCIARNCMGQASSSAELTVEDIQNQLNEEEKLQLFSKNQAPKFIQGLKSVEAKIDEPFRFTVKVAIPPEPSVLWYRDDQPVDESSRYHHDREDRGVFYLDIQSLELLDQAEWKCVAMNDFGHSVTSCFLKLIIPRHYKKPRFLENLQAILSDEGAVNLECKVIGVPQPVLKWYKDGEELKPGDIHRIISGQDGTCCLGTYTCEAQNCMGIAASSASLLGFDDSMKAKKKTEEQALQRNLSLSTIHEERTSQMYDTPVGDVTTLDDKGEISFSFDGKEVSVSLYETPDLTEEEALQIVEMYADQLSENITEHNVVELPPLRFVKETSTSGNLLMEAVIIDVSPDYFVSPDEDMRTEADIEDISIADENGPPQLSLDQDIEIGGEDYLEKTMALLSEDKSDIPPKIDRKKSDSQRSADDFFSLSRDQSLSEEKRDDDTQALSESDLQSFASAHSSGKPKSKSSKPSGEDGQESSDPPKTILYKDEAIKYSLDAEPSTVIKSKRERRSSRSSRRSSSGDEKSVSKTRDEALRKKDIIEVEMSKKPVITDEQFKEKMVNISTSLSKVINDVQIIERDIILKSELMSSAATASRSLEIISSLISPLSEIHSIADAVKESASESKEVCSTLFNNLPQPLKALHQSLTFIEKCIDMETDSKTLVKKTCVAFVQTCGSEMQRLISEINAVSSKDYLLTEDRVLTEIESLNNEMSTAIKFSADTIKARNLLSEASEIKVDEPSIEVNHMRDTQKAVFELKRPLKSLLSIAETAESDTIVDLAKVRNSEIILNDMSGSIQDLQTALEQIETLSVKESTMCVYKYNTEFIEAVMESALKLRSSFEQLSTEPRGEDKAVINWAVASIKENLNKISSQIEVIENNVGTFDVLQSDNKLDALQKMAQILIALENNLYRLELMPEVKNHITTFHKNLTKVLENVIESNDSKKYFSLMEICDSVNRINDSIKNLDVDNVLPLASLNNALRIIQNQFIRNVFDSELNCSILTNITDTFISVQEAINTAEEISIQIDSEHIVEIVHNEYDETKAKVIVEHIDHAIGAIENVKAIESTQDLNIHITPALQNICPVLEELKRNVAAIKATGVEEEHISDISEVSSFAKTFASPICELNQNIIVLNQQIVENIENMKANSEVMALIATPLHELHTTLEILQQDVISQYGEDLTPYDLSINLASAVHNLQSCIVMIQEQTGVEAADEMSTLEDISAIKTTADTIMSDRFVLPAAEETAVEQTISSFNQEIQTTVTAQALQTLNEHITILQTPEIIDALDTLSEVSDYSSLKSLVIGLGELHSGIEEVLHPLLMEGSNEITNLISSSKLTAIAAPMQELKQSLSVLDTSNIPIYENILEIPSERIHSVIQSVTEFKEHLDRCMLAALPALETADNTIEIATKVGALRAVCEHLKHVIDTTKAVTDIPVPEEIKALEITLDSLLDATDVSIGIKFEHVKTIVEELYEKVATVQEEMIQFTPQTSNKLAHEAKLIQTIDEVQSNIAVLEQYDFVDLSRASDLTYTSPKIAAEIESDSLILMEDIVDSAVIVLQDSAQEMSVADLMIVEDFFKNCKNEFTILRCLISKATSHKKIIRLLQEFSALQNTINDFKTKRFELNLSEDINGCLATFLIHADDCLEHVQTSLVKIVDSQAELLIEAPLAKFENAAKVLKAAIKTKQNEQISETVTRFVDILEMAKPSLQNIQADIINEIKSTRTHVDENSTLVNMIEEFTTFVQQAKMQDKDVVTKSILTKVITCIEKHHDYKDASGTGKTLILLKCLSECTDILQESLLDAKVPKQKVEVGALMEVLTEMLEPLKVLHSQLAYVQEQVLRGVDEDSISVDITTTESLVQTMTEKHKEIIERIEIEQAVANEEISLIMEVDKEIHSIQDSLRCMENMQDAQIMKEIAKPVEEIEKSLHCILASENVNIHSEDILPKENAKYIVQHIDQYIELIEIVEEISAIIKIEDIKETLDIAKELRESIVASEIIAEGEVTHKKATEVQNRLAQKLQTALSALQVQVLDSSQELAPVLSMEVLQRIAQVTAQLQADLVAVTGIRVALQAPAEIIIETANLVKTEEEQTAEVTIPEFETAALGLELTTLEQVGYDDQLLSSNQVFATSEILENTIAATKEVVTLEDANLLPTERKMEASVPTQLKEIIAIETIESVVVEQTEAVSTEAVSKEDAILNIAGSNQAQEVTSKETIKTESVSAVAIEDFGPMLHEISPNDEQIDFGIDQKAELEEAPKPTIDILVQHIDQLMSRDITEVVKELPNVIKAEELKQLISIAKELRENIATSEVELRAEAGDVLKTEVIRHQAVLKQQLFTALSALENLSLDTLIEIPSINKDALQLLVKITDNLRADLVVLTAQQDLIVQLVLDSAQLNISDSEVAAITVKDDTNDFTLSGDICTEATVSEIIGNETEKIQTVQQKYESPKTQDIQYEGEMLLPFKTTEPSMESTEIEEAEISIIMPEDVIETKETETSADSLETKPIPLENRSISDKKAVAAEQVLEKSEKSLTEATIEEGALIKHIDEFISDEISELFYKNTVLTNSQELKDSVKLAEVLKENIEFVSVNEELGSLEEAKLDQVKLARKLLDALSTLHTKTLESVEEISPAVKPDSLLRVSEIITHLQEDLEIAIVTGLHEVPKEPEVVQIPEIEQNSMKQLEMLLQEVTDKINHPTDIDTEHTESLRDTLDEVQTVIIKLKRDYDGAANDTLNETLQDLECSVRSVQLQINEDSPPELLKESCATLQLLVNNMSEIQDVRVTEMMEVKSENIIEKCATETEETVKLLESASKVDTKDDKLSSIVSTLSILKDTIKKLKLNFISNADVLIEKGIEVVQSLDQLEDKVFTLEKDLAEVRLSSETRDIILTAVHSVYGSISNMRGTILSIQKRYMFENYGKPSETLLRSIKNLTAILHNDDINKQSWKNFALSLRNVLNHFEDIKFYINLDKTARLPSDAAFTKIILEELKSHICEIMVLQASVLGVGVTNMINNLLASVEKNLASIESRSTLEVREKIPIFKELSLHILNVTDIIRSEMDKLDKDIKIEVIKQEHHILLPELQQEVELAAVQEIALVETQKTGCLDADRSFKEIDKENLITIEQLEDINNAAEEISLITDHNKIETSLEDQPSKTEAIISKVKARKQVLMQETDIKIQIEQIASDLVDEISTEAITTIQNLEETAVLEINAREAEAVDQSISIKVLQEAEISHKLNEIGVSFTEDFQALEETMVAHTVVDDDKMAETPDKECTAHTSLGETVESTELFIASESSQVGEDEMKIISKQELTEPHVDLAKQAINSSKDEKVTLKQTKNNTEMKEKQAAVDESKSDKNKGLDKDEIVSEVYDLKETGQKDSEEDSYIGVIQPENETKNEETPEADSETSTSKTMIDVTVVETENTAKQEIFKDNSHQDREETNKEEEEKQRSKLKDQLDVQKAKSSEEEIKSQQPKSVVGKEENAQTETDEKKHDKKEMDAASVKKGKTDADKINQEDLKLEKEGQIKVIRKEEETDMQHERDTQKKEMIKQEEIPVHEEDAERQDKKRHENKNLETEIEETCKLEERTSIGQENLNSKIKVQEDAEQKSKLEESKQFEQVQQPEICLAQEQEPETMQENENARDSKGKDEPVKVKKEKKSKKKTIEKDEAKLIGIKVTEEKQKDEAVRLGPEQETQKENILLQEIKDNEGTHKEKDLLYLKKEQDAIKKKEEEQAKMQRVEGLQEKTQEPENKVEEVLKSANHKLETAPEETELQQKQEEDSCREEVGGELKNKALFTKGKEVGERDEAEQLDAMVPDELNQKVEDNIIQQEESVILVHEATENTPLEEWVKKENQDSLQEKHQKEMKLKQSEEATAQKNKKELLWKDVDETEKVINDGDKLKNDSDIDQTEKVDTEFKHEKQSAIIVDDIENIKEVDEVTNAIKIKAEQENTEVKARYEKAQWEVEAKEEIENVEFGALFVQQNQEHLKEVMEGPELMELEKTNKAKEDVANFESVISLIEQKLEKKQNEAGQPAEKEKEEAEKESLTNITTKQESRLNNEGEDVNKVKEGTEVKQKEDIIKKTEEDDRKCKEEDIWSTMEKEGKQSLEIEQKVVEKKHQKEEEENGDPGKEKRKKKLKEKKSKEKNERKLKDEEKEELQLRKEKLDENVKEEARQKLKDVEDRIEIDKLESRLKNEQLDQDQQEAEIKNDGEEKIKQEARLKKETDESRLRVELEYTEQLKGELEEAERKCTGNDNLNQEQERIGKDKLGSQLKKEQAVTLEKEQQEAKKKTVEEEKMKQEEEGIKKEQCESRSKNEKDQADKREKEKHEAEKKCAEEDMLKQEEVREPMLMQEKEQAKKLEKLQQDAERKHAEEEKLKQEKLSNKDKQVSGNKKEQVEKRENGTQEAENKRAEEKLKQEKEHAENLEIEQQLAERNNAAADKLKQEEESIEKGKNESWLKEQGKKAEWKRAEGEKSKQEEESIEKEKQESRIKKEQAEQLEKKKQAVERKRAEKEKLKQEEERIEKEKQESRLKKEQAEKLEKEKQETERKRAEDENQKVEDERIEKEKQESMLIKEKEHKEKLEMELQQEAESKHAEDEKIKLEEKRTKKENLESQLKKEQAENLDKEIQDAERKCAEEEKIKQEECIEKEKQEFRLKEEQAEKLKKENQQPVRKRAEEEKLKQEEERIEKEKQESRLKKEHAEKLEKDKQETERERAEEEKLKQEKINENDKRESRLKREQAEKLEKEKQETERKRAEEENQKQEEERIEKEKQESMLIKEKEHEEKLEMELRQEAESKHAEEEKLKLEEESTKKEKQELWLKKEQAESLEKKKLGAERKRTEKEKFKQEEERIAKEKQESQLKKEQEEKERQDAEGEKLKQEECIEKEKQELRLKKEQTEKIEQEKQQAETKRAAEEKLKQDEERIEKEKQESLLEKEHAEELEKEKQQAEKNKQEQRIKKENERLQKDKAKKRKQKEEKIKKEADFKQKQGEETQLENEKLKQKTNTKNDKEEQPQDEGKESNSERENEEISKLEIETLKAEKNRKEDAKTGKEDADNLKEEQLNAENKRTEEETSKKDKETKDKKHKDETGTKEQAAKHKQEDMLKLEEKAKIVKQNEEAKMKHIDEEKRDTENQKGKHKDKTLNRVDETKFKIQTEEDKKREEAMYSVEMIENKCDIDKTNEDRKKVKIEEKRVLEQKTVDEKARLKKSTDEAGNDKKEAFNKKTASKSGQLIKENEKSEARETELILREENREEIEKGLTVTKTEPKSSKKAKSLTEFRHTREENGDVSTSRKIDGEDDHYIREYQYEPSRQRSDEITKFVDHNHRDYTMEFLRPSGYREKTFEHEKYLERESLGGSAPIYKAQSIILESQLRSSAPPQPNRSESEIRVDMYDRSDSEKRVERHRSKALSEARSLISEKRSGLSRDLKRKPVFSTYLTDRTAVEGSRVKLTCSVLSSSETKITWYRNGVLLDNKLKYRTKFMDGLITLEVLNAVVSDSAEYSCTVENENGSVNTSANLKVYPSFEASPIPPTFTRSIRDTYHLAENELVLECRIRGQPLPTITWLKDDKTVSTNERYQAYYLADGVCRLAISSPTSEDSGKYTCKAENSVWSDHITHVVNFTGKESHLSANITTIERTRFNRQALESRRPHFTNVLADYKVAKGGTIGLQVEIKGCPTRVEWLREGRSVIEVYRNARTFVEQGLYTLALSDVTEKESGMYTCRAWSTHGNVDMNAAITVIPPNEMDGKPAIIVGRPEKDILISVGEDVNISFRVQGEPKPKVVFMKGIRDITTNQRVCKMTSDDYVKFTLKRSVVSDAGTYCILARNAYGCDRAFVTVVVRQRASSENLISDWTYPMDDSTLSIAERKYKSVPDRIPGEPSVVDGGNNWISLAWPKADPRDTAPVLAYKIESWLLGKEGGARWAELGITPLNSFDAFNLKQGEEYHFRVTPRNRYGWGESVQTSSPIGIGLAGDRPEFTDILPGQLKVLAGETANLNCSVKGKPLPEVVWMKNGHEIEEESRMKTAYNGHDCSLTIKDICIEDEARYSCEASNVHGRTSTYARLAVVTDRLIWEADAKLKRERSQDAEGDYPPQFTMRLRDRRVQATYPVRLTCQVVGNPPPTVTWFKDGELLVFDSRRNNYQDEHFHTLEIAPTNLDDGGVYEAMARNNSGAVSCRCSLVVDKGIRAYVAPEFCCGLEPLYRLSEGEELRISAVVEAYPSVGVTWYRDGVRLRPSRRAIMTLDRDGQIELALAAVTGRDAGVYTCTASNEVGRASTSGKVEIVEGDQPKEKWTPPVVIHAPDVPYSKEPMFIRKPRSSEAREGDTVIIACEVIGDPKPDVYWLRDFLKPDYYRDASHFKRVGDGPEYRFEIPHAKLDYTGAYSVVARNVHGEAKAIISLQILAKDPSSTDDSHNVRYGRVEVIPRFERELTDLLSYDGDAVEFECHVTGNPEPDIRWFHYHELIRDCPDFESSFDEGAARLKIKQVTADDEGTYSCEASNNLGKAKSSACLVVYSPGEPNTLSQRLRRPPMLLSAASTPRSTPRSTPARSVSRTPGPEPRRLRSPSRQMAPSFYTYPFNKVVEEGENVTFKCAVKGLPAPWATWDKDGIIITPSARISIKEKDELLRILEIEHVSIEDVGMYRITIENEFGRAEASARLEVITQRGKFYGGVRAYSPSPRKSLTYRRYPSVPRLDNICIGLIMKGNIAHEDNNNN